MACFATHGGTIASKVAMKHSFKNPAPLAVLAAALLATACSSDDSESSSSSNASTGSGGTSALATSSAGPATGTDDGESSSANGAATTDDGTSSASTSTITGGGETTTGGTTTGNGGSGTATDGDSTDDSGGSGGQTANTTDSSGGATGSTGGTGMTTSGDPIPSEGCSASEPATDGPATIDVDGTEREYILVLPEGYDPTRPYRLIFAFHGGQYSAQWVVDGDPPQSGPFYGIQAEAENNAILVAPQALSGSWTNQNGRDIAFVDAMLERFKAQLCIDESRVFSAGFSMGGIMTLTIGCERAGIFRAITPMSGSLRNGCTMSDEPVAYWSSHGDNDTTITPEQGAEARDEFIRRNGCSSDSVPTDREGCVSYQGCQAGYPVTWCSFSGVHEPAPYAGEAIWEFLSQF